MKHFFFSVTFLMTVSLFISASSLHATRAHSRHQQHEIKIPLGFNWGDSPQKLEEMAGPSGLTITHRAIFPSSKKTVYTVQGVIGNALLQTIFVFKKNALVEIEYQYGDKNWGAQNYQDFFNAFRRMYDTKYGQGIQLVKNTFNNHNHSNITSSLQGYQWSQASAILELFNYTAEAQDQEYSLVSLHYQAP